MGEKYLTSQPQSQVTGAKNSNVAVGGVFDVSLKNAEFICGKVPSTRLTVLMLPAAAAWVTVSVLVSAPL